jgi:glucose-1-phosphate adenylyltransferase
MGADYFELVPQAEILIGLGENCEMKNVILDKNVRVGKNVRLINKDGISEYQDEYVIIKDGIIVVPKNATIPDDYEI